MRHLYDSLRACAKEEEVKAETRFDGTRVDCAYDAAGNRLAKTDAGGTVSYTLGAGDRLASWTGGSYSHDTAGCVTHIVRGADTLDLTWNGQYQCLFQSRTSAERGAVWECVQCLGQRSPRTAQGNQEMV